MHASATAVSPPDAAPVAVDAAPPPLDAAADVPDTQPPQDRTTAPLADAAGGRPVLPAPHGLDAETPDPEDDADLNPRQVTFQVGCACRLDRRPAGGGPLTTSLMVSIVGRRRRRRS